MGIGTWSCSVDESVWIRSLQPDDAPQLEALRKGYTGFRNEWIYRGAATEFIAESLASGAQGRGFWAGVWIADSLAGVIGFRPYQEPEADPGSGRPAKIDYMLAPAYRGRGVMTQCVRALTRKAFCELGATRLEIRCDAANGAGCRVAERAGFVRALLLPGEIDYGDSHGDLAVYVARADD